MPDDHDDRAATADQPDERTSPDGTIFTASVVRDFLHSALRHEAVSDDVTQRQLEFLDGRLDAAGLAAKLRPMLTEALAAATDADWSQIAADLMADAEELRLGGGRGGAAERPAVPA